VQVVYGRMARIAKRTRGPGRVEAAFGRVGGVETVDAADLLRDVVSLAKVVWMA